MVDSYLQRTGSWLGPAASRPAPDFARFNPRTSAKSADNRLGASGYRVDTPFKQMD
jgi:hypothetical protein